MIFTTAIMGTLTGLIGNSLTAFTNLKTQKLKNQHELDMTKAETNAMIAETEANIKVTEAEVAKEIEMSDAKIAMETIKQSKVKSLSNKILEKLFDKWYTIPFAVVLTILLGFVDVLKGIMRPGLTLYLVLLTSYLTYQAVSVLQTQGDLISAGEALELFQNISNIIIYLTVSCVTWWFGDRRVAKFLYRLQDGNIREK